MRLVDDTAQALHVLESAAGERLPRDLLHLLQALLQPFSHLQTTHARPPVRDMSGTCPGHAPPPKPLPAGRPAPPPRRRARAGAR